MKTEKTISTTVVVETYCRPMYWAVISAVSKNVGDEYVMAMFHSKTDAEFFVERLPPQNLEIRKIVER